MCHNRSRYREQHPVRVEEKEPGRKPLRMSKDERTLAEIIDRERWQHEKEPRRSDRHSLETTHIGVPIVWPKPHIKLDINLRVLGSSGASNILLRRALFHDSPDRYATSKAHLVSYYRHRYAILHSLTMRSRTYP